MVFDRSDSLERDFHRGVNFLIVFWNRLNILVPSIFLANLSQPFFVRRATWVLHVVHAEASSVSVISTHWIWSHTAISWFGHAIPLNFRFSQEWDWIGELLGFLDFINDFPSVRNISIKYKWCGVDRSLELTLSGSHCWTILWSVLDAQGLDLFSSNRISWCVLSEKLRISHSWIIECYVIVHWTIEILSISSMSRVIIFWAFYIEIRNPSELSINIPIFWNSWIVWHSSTLNIVHFIRIWFSLGFYQDWLFWLEVFIEVLSIVGVISNIE